VSPVTTHVLDLSSGRPAAGVSVRLEQAVADGAWREVGAARTDDDGRTGDLARAAPGAGVHRLTFETGEYFRARGIAAFHPRVSVDFVVVEAAQHHHVPLLVAPFGYSTYRGS
jgi:5-hydroxyisourate hydrolase